uniref:Uncharacterized protein n=1 Tax=Strongyloides venezuelensis TaxID=75913 RepID=A0A0K0FJA6_STRVS
MSKHKRDSTSPFDSNFLTGRKYEEIYMDIDDVKSKGKKRAIVDERTEIDERIENGGSGRSLADGITAVGQRNKRGSDVSFDNDIVDESNSSCHSSKSHSLGAARCTDGMSSKGTRTVNKNSILMEKF